MGSPGAAIRGSTSKTNRSGIEHSAPATYRRRINLMKHKIVNRITGTTIEYTCPKCGEQLSNKAGAAGTTDSCPICGLRHTVPGLEALQAKQAQADQARQRASQEREEARKLAARQRERQALQTAEARTGRREKADRHRKSAMKQETFVDRFISTAVDVSRILIAFIGILALVLTALILIGAVWTAITSEADDALLQGAWTAVTATGIALGVMIIVAFYGVIFQIEKHLRVIRIFTEESAESPSDDLQ